MTVEPHLDEYCHACRVTDAQFDRNPQCLREIPDECCRPLEREPPRLEGRGKAMPGQVWCNQRELRGKERQKIAPCVGGCAGAVKEEDARTRPGDLHMPGQATRADEAAGGAVRPIPAFALEIGLIEGEQHD